MATNAEGKEVEDEDEIITEETLRRDKYEKGAVDPSKEEDESAGDDESDDDDSEEDAGDDDGKADDEDQEEDSEEDSNEDSGDEDSDTFIKEFDNIKGDTLPDYARNLEVAYRNSSKEALRLKGELDALQAKGTAGDDSGKSGKDDDKDGDKNTTPTTVSDLYVKQQMDKEIVEAYTEFTKDYNQVDDPSEYKKFESTVGELSQTILNREKRIASPRELYSKAAVILGWTPIEKKPTKSEKVGIALKKKAAVSTKGGGTPKKGAGKSKVTAAMVEMNRKMYPGKSDAEIREELEPYVQS